MKPILFLAVVSATMAGCATDINRKNAPIYYDAGLRAEASQNWPAAKEAYRRSLINARSGGRSPALVSAATYNLGRMTGYTCDYAEAEALLQEATTLEQGLPSPDPGNLTKRWSELARLYQDQGRDQEAAALYGRAVSELERLDVVGQDPVGFANYLDDYANALTGAGQPVLARTVAARAATLRAEHAGQVAKFVPLRFEAACARFKSS